MNYTILIVVVIYLLCMVAIGIYSYRFTKTREGFHLGGRRLSSWVAAFSYAFSGMSAWVLIGYVGMVYKLGPSSFYILIGFNLGFIFAYMVIAKRLRNYSQLLDSITYTDYFVKRVRDNTHLIRFISAVAIIVFMSAYVASQFSAAGKTMQTLFGLSPVTAIIISAVVVTLYCMLGGFLAVSLTDYIQGLLIIIGTFILGFVLVSMAGGWSQVVTEAAKASPILVSANLGKTGLSFIGMVFGFLVFGMYVIGRPHDTIRFFAIKSSSEVRKSLVICIGALTLTYWAAFLVGYVGRVMMPGLKDPEMLFPLILTQKVNPILGGILLAVLMGLIMSTVDSQLLISASTFTEDIYGKYIDKQISEKKSIFVSRLVVAVIAALSVYIAITSPESVFWLAIYASAGLASTFAPVLILSLYWDRLTNWGAITGMASGFVMNVVWQNMGLAKTVNQCIPAFAVAFLVAFIVSKLSAPPNMEEVRSELSQVAKVWKS